MGKVLLLVLGALLGSFFVHGADRAIPQLEVEKLVSFQTSEVVTPIGVQVTSQGMVLVPDRGAHCIHVWNSDGSSNKIIGRYGKGPGEFEFRNAWPQIDSDGKQILLVDRDRLHFFDEESLQFIKTEHFPLGRVRQFHVLDNGNYLVERFLRDNSIGQYRFQLLILDASTLEIKTLVDERLDAIARILPNRQTQYRPWGEHLVLDLLPNRQSLVMGNSLSPSLEFRHQDGQVYKRINTPFKPRDVTQEEIVQMRAFYQNLSKKTSVRNKFTLDAEDQPTFNYLMVLPNARYLVGNYQSYSGVLDGRIIDDQGRVLAIYRHDFGEMGNITRSDDRYFTFEIGPGDDWIIQEVSIEMRD